MCFRKPEKAAAMKKGILFLLLSLTAASQAQQPYRVGTTAANFLEIGYGAAGTAMGDAQVALAGEIASLYWNPAGIAQLRHNEAGFYYQPWIAGISTTFAGAGVVLPRLGTLALGLYHTGYGEMRVTTIPNPEGTGEQFNAQDYCFSATWARSLAEWFSFGLSAKFITSQIWHMNASAFAMDLGVVIQTRFFSFSGRQEDAMSIGMSIANYGTRMRYDGIDLLQPIDILPGRQGNYADAEGQFRPKSWELPLIFRVGIVLKPLVRNNQQLYLAADALHQNNNSESVNLGLQYQYAMPAFGTLFLRAGYKALFMVESQYGPSLGAGLQLRLVNRLPLRFEYSWREIGDLGGAQGYSVSLQF